MAKVSWLDALHLETKVALIIQEQAETGVFFDIGKAHYLINELDGLLEECTINVRKYLKDVVDVEELKDDNGDYKYVSKIYNKDGSYSAQVIRYMGENAHLVGGPFTRITIRPVDLAKRDGDVIKQLLSLGWKPTITTEKGTPKLTHEGEPVESLEAFGEVGKWLAKYYTLSHRQNAIKGFIEHVRDDQRIPAECNPCGTNTFRAKHRIVANIPRPTSIYGKELRSLFCVPKGRVFVGADVSGLELRMLAHYMKDEEYINVILNGDIHTYNMEKGAPYLTTRNQAKTFILV